MNNSTLYTAPLKRNKALWGHKFDMCHDDKTNKFPLAIFPTVNCFENQYCNHCYCHFITECNYS